MILTFLLFQGNIKSEENSKKIISKEVRDLSTKITKYSNIKAGYVVCLGSRNGMLVSALAENNKYYVQALEPDKPVVDMIREDLQKMGVNHNSSVVQGELNKLPYVENLINLVVVENLTIAINKHFSLKETFRILVPNGVLMLKDEIGEQVKKINISKRWEIKKSGTWSILRKPRNPKMGNWAQWAGGADRNMMTQDEVITPANEIRWMANPRTGARAKNATLQGFISSGGRIFFKKLDWAKDGRLSQWYLVAMDAYNGFELWKTPLGKTGVSNLSIFNHSLASSRQKIFVKQGKKMLVYNTQNGKALNFSIEPAKHLVIQDNILIGNGEILFTQDLKTGKVFWKTTGNRYLPPAVGKSKVFHTQKQFLLANDLKTGKEVWRTPKADLIIKDGSIRNITFGFGRVFLVSVSKGNFQVGAIDSNNGKPMWSFSYKGRFQAIIAYDDQVWVMGIQAGSGHNAKLEWTILNSKTGKEIKRYLPTGANTTRCYPPRATLNYILYGNGWHLDRHTLKATQSKGVRSYCGRGQIPANGLEYFLPTPCVCNVMLRGVYALSGSNNKSSLKSNKLIKGKGLPLKNGKITLDDWPSYRKDIKRSNFTSTKLPKELKKLWSLKMARGPIAQATNAYGTTYVADRLSHKVIALNSLTGQILWSFTADGKIASSPTLYKGLCLFGSRNGWVYAISAKSGKLVWSLRVAPNEKYIASFGQIESTWPVMGDILIQNDKLYFCAGRVGSMDGGFYVGALIPETGKIIWQQNIKGLFIADIPIGDGKDVFICGIKFNGENGKYDNRKFSPRGILSCRYNKGVGRVSIWDAIASWNPIISAKHRGHLSDRRVVGENIVIGKDTSFAIKRISWPMKVPRKDYGRYMIYASGKNKWEKMKTPMQFNSIVQADNILYCAGKPEYREINRKAELWVINSEEGKIIQKIELESYPTYDGLSAANGQLYLTTEDGKVICFGNK